MLLAIPRVENEMR